MAPGAPCRLHLDPVGEIGRWNPNPRGVRQWTTPTPRITGAFARRHVAFLLRQGYSLPVIADAAGLDLLVLFRILRGRGDIRPATHDALLALRPRAAASINTEEAA